MFKVGWPHFPLVGLNKATNKVPRKFLSYLSRDGLFGSQGLWLMHHMLSDVQHMCAKKRIKLKLMLGLILIIRTFCLRH